MLVPAAARCLKSIHRFVFLVEKGIRQTGRIRAVFELGLRNFRGLVEVAVSVQKLMHLILYLSLQIELFQQPRNLFLNISRLTATFDHFILDSFFYRPKCVAIFHILEDQLTLLGVGQVHIGCATLEH